MRPAWRSSPDLATDLGKSSDGGKTWTYTLQEGLKFEDGSPITSKDVAYAVLRSMDKTTFTTAPEYFRSMLDITMCNKDEGITKNCYDGPYRTPKFDTSSAVTTPDDQTIVFHLKEPFAGFDYMAQLPQTVPVPKAKDTGSKYTKHVIASGPYMFDGEFDPATGFKLVRNPNWDAATDPNRKALPDEMTVKLGMEPNDVDNQVLADDIDIDIEALGLRSAALTKVLQDDSLQKKVDNPVLARLWYTSINPTVKPLENIDCRKAIVYAMNPTSYQNAYGGKFAGGEIATTMLPPMIPGYEDFDLYGVKDNPNGQADKAKEALEACGKPDGFEINMGFRSERPQEKATAEAFQEALGKVGIKVTPEAVPGWRLLLGPVRQAGLRGEEQPRSVHQRMGGRLERRVRLPVTDRGQPRDPADRWFVEHLRPHPRGGQDARQGRRSSRTRRSARRCGVRSTGGSWKRQ